MTSRSTPSPPFPIVRDDAPTSDNVLRNCCMREPLPGGASIMLVGYDGGGHPWTRMHFALTIGEDKINSWARLIERESQHMPALLESSRVPLFGPRLVKP